MAFTKKFTGKKAAPKPVANYARKKREEEAEVEEVQEVDEVEAEQEEVADDYDNEQEAPAPAPRRAPAPAPAPRQAPRAFGGQSQGQGGGEQKKALRLTGLFAGKREGCFSGKLRDEDADNLAALIEEAKATNQQVVFFVWENQGNPQFSLTANISAPFKGGFNRGGNGGGGFNRGGNSGGFRKRW